MKNASEWKIYLFRVPVEEKVNHDLPGHLAADGASQAEDLTGQHPPHETDGVDALVVAWDGNIHIFQGAVSVAQGNHRDVDIGSLSDGLVVSARVSHYQQAGLTEGSLSKIEIHNKYCNN